MTSAIVGIIYPGYSAEDDLHAASALFPEIRFEIVHSSVAVDAHEPSALRDLGRDDRLVEAVTQFVEKPDVVIWACTSGSFIFGLSGALRQIDELSRVAGCPASSTSLAFLHAIEWINAERVAVAATYPSDITSHFVSFLEEGGIEVVSSQAGGILTGLEVATMPHDAVIDMAVRADDPRATAVLIPDTALHTVGCLNAIERRIGKPVLTANQVTIWQGLRLARVRLATEQAGILFTRMSS